MFACSKSISVLVIFLLFQQQFHACSHSSLLSLAHFEAFGLQPERTNEKLLHSHNYTHIFISIVRVGKGCGGKEVWVESKSSKTTTQKQIFVIPFHERRAAVPSFWCETNSRNKWNLGNFLFSFGIRTKPHTHISKHTHADDSLRRFFLFFWKSFVPKQTFSLRDISSRQRIGISFSFSRRLLKRSWMCALKRWFSASEQENSSVLSCFQCYFKSRRACMCTFEVSFPLAR